jgi:hypothetical protein
MSQDAFCPRCGQPRQVTPTCSCGYLFQGQVSVSGKTLVGPSPMSLPCHCVKCGKDASGGDLYDRTLYGYPQWIVAAILFGVLPLLVLYYALRKPLRISYYTCPACVRSRKKKLVTTWGLWALFVASLVAAIGMSSSAIGIASAALFVAAVVMSALAAAPLRVLACAAGLFTVKGAGPEFLAYLGGPRP